MPASSLEGHTLGKYRVMAPLGAGGMARVYRAYHPQLNRHVAVKVLRADLLNEPEFLARFQREAQAVAALRHPNIVQVFDFDQQDDVYYLVMELLEGDSLKARLNEYRAQGSAMPPGEAARVLLDALAGLDYAHGEGLIHRDLKPANLMLTRRGQAVLTDFGIAQIVGGPKHTVTGTLMGTLSYMAPEQGLHGQWGTPSDLYSMGVVFYEMLTGRVPFDADTPLAILMKHVNEPLPLPRALNPDIPDALERVLLKALSKQPADRFQSAREMGDAVQTALNEAGLPLPERLAPLPAPPAPVQLVGVFSGPARAALDGASFAEGDTDTTLGARLRSSVLNTQGGTPVRGLDRAVYLGLGAFVVVTLLGIGLGGASADAGRFASAAWPVEIFLLVFLLCLVMEALASIWLVGPISFLLTIGILLNYYALTQRWGQWFWWPLLPLIVMGEIGLAIRWARPSDRSRARRLGQAAGVFTGALAVLSLIAALIVAAR
jgi:tRNA A-37 threonylcarbamoyl transferase component Bud32